MNESNMIESTLAGSLLLSQCRGYIGFQVVAHMVLLPIKVYIPQNGYVYFQGFYSWFGALTTWYLLKL